jgi:UDP-N-acetylmuramoylalanine--D-glutamate ligase
MKLDGARVVVIGMARSGIAAVELLLEKGAKVRAVDEKGPGAGGQVPVKIEAQSSAALADADLIVLSPGVPADLDIVNEARRRGVRVIGDLELASWYLQGSIIGITGSNGKTTTTALTGHILESSGIAAQVGGNIGRPPASMVNTSRDGQWNVLELSSFQLETIETFHAKIGAALNVTPDHLDRHYTLENYAEAKARLFANQREGDFAVLNADDTICRSYAGRGGARPVWFSSTQIASPGAFLENGNIMLDGAMLMPCSEVRLRGVHNLENTMAAAAMAKLAGATHEQIRAAVATFPGVEHRLEFVRDTGGIEWFNDSKATNVDATLKAIAAFEGGLWIILGGKDKNSDYSPLAEPLLRKAHGVLLIGAAAEKIESQLSAKLGELRQVGVGPLPSGAAHSVADRPGASAEAPSIIRCGTMERAVAYAREHVHRGDTVLLAPACSSFDQFDNYEHRGRVFKRLVQEIAWPD